MQHPTIQSGATDTTSGLPGNRLAGMTTAYGFTEYGGPDTQSYFDVTLPPPGAGQLLVSVRAAGVNPADWKVRAGTRKDTVPVTLPAVLGPRSVRCCHRSRSAGHRVRGRRRSVRRYRDRLRRLRRVDIAQRLLDSTQAAHRVLGRCRSADGCGRNGLRRTPRSRSETRGRHSCCSAPAAALVAARSRLHWRGVST